MNFAFWFAPAAASVICIARSNLGHAGVAALAAAGAAVLARARPLGRRAPRPGLARQTAGAA